MANGNGRVTQDIDRPVALVLLSGMALSMALIFIGIVLYFLRPEQHLHTVLPARQAAQGFLRLHASAWLSLGLLALIVTPVARVMIAIGSFARIRDWRYVLVSVVVLIAMLAGVALKKG